MGLSYLVLLFVALLHPLLSDGEMTPSLNNLTKSDEKDLLKNQIIYMSQTGNAEGAIDLYRKLCKLTGAPDYDLLGDFALSLLSQGSRSEDPEEKLLTYYGAGLGLNDQTIPILESGLFASDPKLQLICLNFLASLDSDLADESIKLLFRNPNPLLQLEAAFCMAKKKHPMALSQSESLLTKFPKELRAIFPILFASLENPRANSILRQLLNDPDEKVRLETLLVLTEKGRDDFLPQIRRLSKQTYPIQQEVTSTALGRFSDAASTPRLKELVDRGNPYVCVAAAYALYTIGHKEYSDLLIDAARKEFLFAIILLKDVEEGKETLFRLTKSPKAEVRLNATIALLGQKDRRALIPLKELLMNDGGLLIVKGLSPGKSMFYYRFLPYHQLTPENGAIASELSRGIRGRLLQEALALPDEDFLYLAKTLLNSNRNDLIPLLVQLLENSRSEEAISLLKDYEQKIGDPLVRSYCCLALYRLGEEGHYEEKLREFVRAQSHIEIIQFKPFIPQEARLDLPTYELTPKESSQLYVEALESLTKAQGEKDILTLLEAIEKGNKKNRFALAGLLMRAVK